MKRSRRERDRALNDATVAAHGRPSTRRERMLARMAADDWAGAFRSAVALAPTHDDRMTVERAYEALQRPAFCRQIGRDPDQLIEAGKAVLRRMAEGG